jgi:hypothetical protein
LAVVIESAARAAPNLDLTWSRLEGRRLAWVELGLAALEGHRLAWLQLGLAAHRNGGWPHRVGALVEDRYVGGIGSGDNQKEGKDDAKRRIHGA